MKEKKKILTNSTTNIIRISLLLCLVCSIIVSSLAILFRNTIENNQKLEVKRYILEIANLYNPKTDKDVDIIALFQKKVEKKLVDLKTGEYITDNNVPDYDMVKASKKPDMSIPMDKNLAGVLRVPKIGVVYLIKDENNQVTMTVFHVWGRGLWSTLYGFFAVKNDMNTIDGLSFYAHGETPGLGGEVDNPKWKSQWVGKKIYDTEQNYRIQVIKGQVDNSTPNAIYQVDGLSGATITANGVTYLLEFWLGEQGYGSYIQKKKSSS